MQYVVNRPTFGYGGHLGSLRQSASDLPTTIEQMGADISAAIQASTRPNVPAYIGNMVTATPTTAAIGVGTLLAIAAGAVAVMMIARRRR